MRIQFIRFKGGPYSRRSYFVNEFLVRNLGKTKSEMETSIESWSERIPTPKYGEISLSELLDKAGQTVSDMLRWTTEDFTFFSWDKVGRLQLNAENLETCLLVDRLLVSGVLWGDNQGRKPDTVLWAWKKDGLEGLRRLAAKYLEQ